MKAKALFVLSLLSLPVTIPVFTLLLPTVVAIILSLFFVILPNRNNPPVARSARENERVNKAVVTLLLLVAGCLLNVWWPNWLLNLLLTA